MFSYSRPTHGEGSLVVHLSHGDVSAGRVQQEDLLVVAQLELRVQGVNDRNGSVGLLEGDRHQKPVEEQIRTPVTRCKSAFLGLVVLCSCDPYLSGA